MGVLDDAIREHLALKRRHGVSEAELERQEKEALGPARREPSPRESAEQTSASAEAPEVDIDMLGDAPEPGVVADRPAAGDQIADEGSPDDLFEEYGAEPPDAADEEATRIRAPAGLDDERIMDEEELAEEELADELAGREGGPEGSEGLAATPLAADSEAESPTEEHTTVYAAPPPHDPAELDRETAIEEEEALLEEEEEWEPPVADERPLGEEAALTGDDELLEDEPAPSRVEEPDSEVPQDGPDADEDEDVLEDTPDFLQETPEHERLWFEQKPPRDFDLDR